MGLPSFGNGMGGNVPLRTTLLFSVVSLGVGTGMTDKAVSDKMGE